MAFRHFSRGNINENAIVKAWLLLCYRKEQNYWFYPTNTGFRKGLERFLWDYFRERKYFYSGLLF